jgi:NDP-sugar pyrophosphorylase family protein
MLNEGYKVLVTASGTGSRLGVLTKDTNKALVLIGGRPAIEYIIRMYPRDATLVFTLGYLGGQLREYLEKNHRDRRFEFVEVDKYEGLGSSLGYSMLRAKEKLQCPFIFNACDTIVTENIPAPDANWIGGFAVGEDKADLILKNYRTHQVENGRVIKLKEKGAMGFDSVHIGLVGVNDYKEFWETLEKIYDSDPDDGGLSDAHVLNKMIASGIDFSWKPFSVWLDTGTVEALGKTEEYLSNHA